MSADKPVTTSSQTVGPFFHFGIVTKLGQSAPPASAPPIGIAVRVLDGEGNPLDDALVEFWHRTAGEDTARCGRLATNKAGACSIETVLPDGHVNICLFARGLLRHLFTRIYFPGDPSNDADPVLSLVPADRRQTLFAAANGPGRWTFDIHLQGPQETVFFDQ